MKTALRIAGEVISTVQMVMQAQMPYAILRDGVLTHPATIEGLNLLFSLVVRRTQVQTQELTNYQ